MKKQASVPILMFHGVSPGPMTERDRGVSVQIAEFAQYMRYLEWRGYQGINCADLIDRTSVKKPVVLTFDDGYASLYDHVHPLFSSLGWRCTVFLVWEYVGKQAGWEGAPEGRLLDWKQISEMGAQGVEFGSHTLTHPSLTKIDLSEARAQITESKLALERKLGKPVRTFAYPYGHWNMALRDLAAEAGYELAVTTDHGRVQPGDDFLALPRISVYHVPPLSLKFGPRMANFQWRVETRKDDRSI